MLNTIKKRLRDSYMKTATTVTGCVHFNIGSVNVCYAMTEYPPIGKQDKVTRFFSGERVTQPTRQKHWAAGIKTAFKLG
jgi:hypothetical protein